MKTSPPAPRWASLESAASYAGIGRSTLYKLLDRGSVESSRVGTRRLVDLRSLDSHLERCRVGGPRPASLSPAAVNSPATGGTGP